MPITDSDIAAAIAVYLDRYPEEKADLTEPVRLLAEGENFASRRHFSMHVTVGALLTRGGDEVLLVGHRAYGIPLQPGGHLEPDDTTLTGAALHELVEETGIDPIATGLISSVGFRPDRRRTSRSIFISMSDSPLQRRTAMWEMCKLQR